MNYSPTFKGWEHCITLGHIRHFKPRLCNFEKKKITHCSFFLKNKTFLTLSNELLVITDQPTKKDCSSKSEKKDLEFKFSLLRNIINSLIKLILVCFMDWFIVAKTLRMVKCMDFLIADYLICCYRCTTGEYTAQAHIQVKLVHFY